MSDSGDEKTVSVRIDRELVDDVDRTLHQLKADGDIPLDYSRSDIVREFFRRFTEDPSMLQRNDADESEGD